MKNREIIALTLVIIREMFKQMRENYQHIDKSHNKITMESFYDSIKTHAQTFSDVVHAQMNLPAISREQFVSNGFPLGLFDYDNPIILSIDNNLRNDIINDYIYSSSQQPLDFLNDIIEKYYYEFWSTKLPEGDYLADYVKNLFYAIDKNYRLSDDDPAHASLAYFLSHKPKDTFANKAFFTDLVPSIEIPKNQKSVKQPHNQDIMNQLKNLPKKEYESEFLFKYNYFLIKEVAYLFAEIDGYTDFETKFKYYLGDNYDQSYSNGVKPDKTAIELLNLCGYSSNLLEHGHTSRLRSCENIYTLTCEILLNNAYTKSTHLNEYREKLKLNLLHLQNPKNIQLVLASYKLIELIYSV